MSIWDEEWEDYELDKHDFEVWLDSLQAEQVRNSKCPEWIIETPKFIYRICLN